MFPPHRLDRTDHARRLRFLEEAKRRAGRLLAEPFYPFDHQKSLPRP